MITDVDDYTHLFELLPAQCIQECSSSGDNYPAVERWVEKLGINIPRAQCINQLKEFGAWDTDELNDESDKELNIKYLWCASGWGD